MKLSATALPRKSASDTGLLSCEVSVKGGAVPITGSPRPPSAPCADSEAGNTSSPSVTTKAMRLGLPRPARARLSSEHLAAPNERKSRPNFVLAGLVPAIHALWAVEGKTWMRGSSLRKTTFNRFLPSNNIAAQLSRLQLAFKLVEEAKIGTFRNDLLRA